MSAYEIHFRDQAMQVFETEEFEAHDDAAAVAHARGLHEKSPRHGFVLMRDTIVICEHYPPAANGTAPY